MSTFSLPVANIIVDTFTHGGVIMWPLLGLSLISIAVVVERAFWLYSARRSRNQAELTQVYAVLTSGDEANALARSRTAADPRLRVIAYGLEHVEIDIGIAAEVRAESELREARRFISVMDTIVTLAPLLGLLGTVTGIMRSFRFVGADQDLAATKVSGGIGEALIATAFGLGIAIFTLIPFNFLVNYAEELRSELESVGKNLRLLVEKARNNRRDQTYAEPSVR
jgi:biopolymer transport protein ExbB